MTCPLVNPLAGYITFAKFERVTSRPSISTTSVFLISPIYNEIAVQPTRPKTARLKLRRRQNRRMRTTVILLTFALSMFASPQSDQWRAERRLIDLHQHINYSEEHLARAVRIMDASGIGIGVNLSGGATIGKDGQP